MRQLEKILQFNKIGMDCYGFHSRFLSSSVIPLSDAPAAPYRESFPPPSVGTMIAGVMPLFSSIFTSSADA